MNKPEYIVYIFNAKKAVVETHEVGSIVRATGIVASLASKMKKDWSIGIDKT